MNHKLCTKDLDIKALAAKAAKQNLTIMDAHTMPK